MREHREARRMSGKARAIDQCAHLPMPPLFRALFDHALDARHITVELRVDAEREAGFLTEHCPDGHDPSVFITAAESIERLDDEIDTILLAHELGHHESWLREEASPEFDEIMAWQAANVRRRPQDFEAAIRIEMLHDEIRAWRYGRAILSGAVPAFDAWVRFDETERECLHGYLRGLLLDDQAPVSELDDAS